jgi:hypothetical protein
VIEEARTLFATFTWTGETTLAPFAGALIETAAEDGIPAIANATAATSGELFKFFLPCFLICGGSERNSYDLSVNAASVNQLF